MVFIASKFDDNEILCNVPPHQLRIDLQAKCFKSDMDSDQRIVDSNENGIPIEMILIGFSPCFGNLGMRNQEEFIRIAYVGVSPSHRLLPPRCVTCTMVSGKSSQKNFIGYFQNLYNNRISCASVITCTRFAGRSFSEKDPTTGQDVGKINYNVLEFYDRPAATTEEQKLIKDIESWMEGEGPELISGALRSHIPGAQLVELPLGADHDAIKKQFALEHSGITDEQPLLSEGVTASGSVAGTSGTMDTVPKAKKSGKKDITITPAQAEALGLDLDSI